eukprot:6196720-Pleurochrysis_carterae.AAC.1
MARVKAAWQPRAGGPLIKDCLIFFRKSMNVRVGQQFSSLRHAMVICIPKYSIGGMAYGNIVH